MSHRWISHVTLSWMGHVTLVKASCHVALMNQSCDTYKRVMWHKCQRITSVRRESCHTYEWVMSHIWMSHITHMNESCHTYEWVMSRIWMSHVTHMPVCGASKARMSHFTHIYESFHTHANASPMWGANRACLAEWKCCCINAANPLACRFGVGAVFICEVEKGEGVRSKHAHTLHPHLHTHTYAHVWAHAHNHKRTQTEYRG